jgi:hypothetical protein
MLAALRAWVRARFPSWFRPTYRPERHYMRGPSGLR